MRNYKQPRDRAPAARTSASAFDAWSARAHTAEGKDAASASAARSTRRAPSRSAKAGALPSARVERAPAQREPASPGTPATSQANARPQLHARLPPRLLAGLERLSGFDLSAVRVHHHSREPGALAAHALARGNDIHLAGGQERHLPHEAWHVVQQAQGRVPATARVAGRAINDDARLEREADVMGARALRVGEASLRRRAAPPHAELHGDAGSSEGEQEVDTRGPDIAQRKIGFEMEYAVPLCELSRGDRAFLSRPIADATRAQRIAAFLTGAPRYDNDHALAKGTGFGIHVDHELEIQNAFIALDRQLRADGMVGNWKKGYEIIAIPEYVTSAFDELGTNADHTIRSALNAVSASMQQVFAAGHDHFSPMPGAGRYMVGVPVDDILAYYRESGVNPKGVRPCLEALRHAVQDRIAPQATIGIIPSALYQAHQNLITSAHMTTNAVDPAIGGTMALQRALQFTDRIMQRAHADDGLQALGPADSMRWQELRGIVTLIANYIVGEAYYRSTAFEDYKSVKNAVPLMSKISLHRALSSAPALERALTPDMLNRVLAAICQDPYMLGSGAVDADRIRGDLHAGARTHAMGKAIAADDSMLMGRGAAFFATETLHGRQIEHRGKRFAGPDVMPAAVRRSSGEQSGIPLEYRRLAVRPNAAGLVAALWPLVDETRLLNMQHMTAPERANALWWTQRSRWQVTGHYAGAALQGARGMVNVRTALGLGAAALAVGWWNS